MNPTHISDGVTVLAGSYFDGHVLRADGPYGIRVADGKIASIERLCDAVSMQSDLDRALIRCPFVMPGLVESHCHLFLDGTEVDTARRAAYLKSGFEEMLEVARRNARASLAAGITLVRDAGDRYGVNDAIKRELHSPDIRSPGFAINSPGRYGSFMARSVADTNDVRNMVGKVAETADDLKILLTGIIDFANGCVLGAPQFGSTMLQDIVAAARESGLPTFAHCSGIDGLRLAVEAGVDSIEHGFFMDEATLAGMASKGIAWVPTFAPVKFQWEEPHYCGWNDATVGNLRRILDGHAEHVRRAAELGVAVIPGSDAGSHGVAHGTALIEEMLTLHECGMSMGTVLASATSLPRARWGVESADIVVDNAANLVGFERSPFEHPASLRSPLFVYHRGQLLT